MPSSLSASQLLAVADDNITASSTSLRVAEIHNLPDHATRELCGNDIAVIQLSNALNDITPIALDLETVPELDQSLTLVGYGVFDLADTSAFGPRHRREEALVDHVGAEGEYMVDGEFSVDRGPCAGDSGSPALSDADAVVGVMSRGNQTSCTHMVYERIDTHAAWLKDLARQSASRLGIAPPEWAEEPSVEEPDPEDGSDDGDEPADGDDDAGDTGDSGDTGDTGNAGDNSSVAAGSGAGDGECSIGSSKQRAPLAAMAWLLCGLLLRRRFARDRA